MYARCAKSTKINTSERKRRMAKSLTILVDAQWLDHEKIAALIAKGHSIHTAPDADLILSANAHWWSAEMWKYLPVALKRARARKKEMRDA